MKHFLTMQELTPKSFEALLDRAIEMKKKRSGYEKVLQGKVLGLIFHKKSTRTRVSFEAGIAMMGGTSLYLGINDLQLSRGEPIKDTARVLSRYLAAVVIRTFAQKEIEEMAEFGSIPVINALTDDHHPCQSVADYMTVREIFGKRQGLKVTYIGDGNNVAHSLMFGAALGGQHFTCLSPKGYQPNPQFVAQARELAGKRSEIIVTDDFDKAVKGSHVLYTDVWTSMGQEEESAKRLKAFHGYQVDDKLMRQADKECIFLHCLPAHRGEEVTDGVLESSASKVWQQAENRMWGQMALMEKLLGS